MSTVIWHQSCLYSDSRGTLDDKIIIRDGLRYPTDYSPNTKKMFKINGVIYAGVGSLKALKKFTKMKSKTSDATKVFAFTLDERYKSFIFRWDGKNLDLFKGKPINFYFFNVMLWKRERLEYSDSTYYMLGSGMDYALEAMDLGLEPEEAIHYAADRDPLTDHNIVKMTLTD